MRPRKGQGAEELRADVSQGMLVRVVGMGGLQRTVLLSPAQTAAMQPQCTGRGAERFYAYYDRGKA